MGRYTELMAFSPGGDRYNQLSWRTNAIFASEFRLRLCRVRMK